MPDKKDIVSQYAGNEEERLLLARVLDIAAESDRGYVTCTSFLDPHERTVSEKMLTSLHIRHLTDGGYDMAERAVIIFPGDTGFDTREELLSSGQYPIVLLKAEYPKNRFVTPPGHRDYLGALMGLQIKRSTVGDIVITEDAAYIFTLNEMAGFISENLTSAGRTPVSLMQYPVSEFSESSVSMREENLILASPRLDVIIGEGFHMSRSKAAQLIKSGKALLRFQECTSVSAKVDEGDVITLRGFGRLKFIEITGTTKKGNLVARVEKSGK